MSRNSDMRLVWNFLDDGSETMLHLEVKECRHHLDTRDRTVVVSGGLIKIASATLGLTTGLGPTKAL